MIEIVEVSEHSLWKDLVVAYSPATKQIAWPMGAGIIAIETFEEE